MSDEETSDSGLGGMGWPWWSAGVVVVAVVAGLLYVLLSPAGSGGDEPAAGATASTTSTVERRTSAAPSSAPVTSSTRRPASGDAGCNGSSPSDKRPAAAPAGVRWAALAGGSVPVSKEFGPAKVEGDTRRCFQHSPTGALLAAANLVQVSFSGPAGAKAVAERQMTPGAARTKYLAEAADTEPEGAEPAGFRLGACSPRACTVHVVFFAGGVYAQYSPSLVWRQGDWVLDGRREIPASAGHEAPAGFAPWGPGQ